MIEGVLFMKKIVSLMLCIALLCTMVALTGCSATTLKFGAGVYVSTPSTADATADKNGNGSVEVTIAAVTVDAGGKIASCALDTIQNKVEFTADGKGVAAAEFKTKRELGDSYNMVAYGKGQAMNGGDVTKEWYQQVDALEDVVVGKTLDEVKALVVEGKGNDEVTTAGCTIYITDYIAAIEKAYNSAAESTVTAADTLKVSAYTIQEIADATADKDGSNKVSVYTFAAAVGADSKIVAAASDCVEVDFTFDTAGKSQFDATKEIKSKKEQGSNYGMTAIGKQEWYIQAAAFDSQCIGKTAAEIVGLMSDDGKGVESVQTAGCTIYVTGFVKAASKI